MVISNDPMLQDDQKRGIPFSPTSVKSPFGKSSRSKRRAHAIQKETDVSHTTSVGTSPQGTHRRAPSYKTLRRTRAKTECCREWKHPSTCPGFHSRVQDSNANHPTMDSAERTLRFRVISPCHQSGACLQ